MNQIKPAKKSKAAPTPVIDTNEVVEISTTGDLTIEADTVVIPDLSIAPDTLAVLADAFGIGKVVASPPTAWETTDTGYPEPTVITIDENTDLSKIADMAQDFGAPKVRRVAIGIKMFLNEEDFMAWQQAEPRELFEITP